MRWFEEKRLEWIGERLAAKGHINRRDIEEKFGISTTQASKDLNNFLRNCPDLMTYNPSARRYEFNYRYAG